MAASVPEETLPSAAAQAKRLLRISRTGALATLGRESGAPLTTWVGFASDFDGAPLFLFSELAQHTKNLAVDARGSLLLTSPPDRGDPLNHPRVTVGGAIARHPDPYARKRYLQRNPKAKLYSPFADFAIYRMRIEAVHFNGGFGRADPLTAADILTPAADASALIEVEDRLLEEVNGPGGSLSARLAPRGDPGRRVWRAIGLDAEGLDLAAGGLTARIDFSAPAFDPQGWRRRLEEALAKGEA
ncbi:MAG: pyridoxamine 5'-phosphate oxidase family protein [Roseiarcus sp.]|jgi:putative heme iron utilization protein